MFFTTNLIYGKVILRFVMCGGLKMENSNKKINWMGILPLIFIVAIVPIVVHLKLIEVNDPFYKSFNLTKDADFYSYYKMLAFLFFTAIAICVVIIKFIAGDFDLKKSFSIYACLTIFVTFSLFSYLLSSNRTIAFLGYAGRYEGILMLIAYMFILFFAINLVSSENDVRLIFCALTFSSFIIGVIGILQLIGHDFFKTSFGKNLMTFGVKGIDMSSITTIIGEKTVYSTLYNPDYVGSFMAIVFPLFLSLTFLLREIRYKILFGFMTLFMFLNLIGSRTRAGIVGIFAAIVIFAILYRKTIIKNFKFIILFAVGLIIILSVVNKATAINTRTTNIIPIENVTISNNTVSIFIQNDILNVTLSKNGVQFMDSNNKVIPAKINNGKISLDYYKYQDFSFQYGMYNKNLVLSANIFGIRLAFGLTDNGVKFLNSRYQLVDIQPVESFGFEGYEQLGSSRGYIWARSLPLLKHTLLIGYGPDTFAVHFPQDDFIGKIKGFGNIAMLVDKPHNFYLQTAINTGVVSLLALLGIFGIYFIQGFKLYFNSDFSENYSIFGVSILVAVVGYLGTALFNDSVVSVAPVFWVLLGVGISINLKLINDRKVALKHK